MKSHYFPGMQDILTRSDIKKLVNAFYEKVLADDVIGHFFHDVLDLDLEKHMPVLYDFWESLLLDNMVYQGNAMLKHMDLHRKSPLQASHFERWLDLWVMSVNENFAGPIAQKAISRAQSIAQLMQLKVNSR